MIAERWAAIVASTKPQGVTVATSGENATVTIVNATCEQPVYADGNWTDCTYTGDAEVHADLLDDAGLWVCPECGAYNEASLLREATC